MNEWQHEIINLFTNNRGKYQRGWKNSKSPEDLLVAMHINWNGDRNEKCYKRAQIELNRFCSNLIDKGDIAGAISSCPSQYTISANEKETTMIFCNHKNQFIGRIEKKMKIGKGKISLEAPQKFIEDLREIKNPQEAL